MRKIVPFLIVTVAVFLFAWLLLKKNNHSERVMDERITLNHGDKIPYGTAVAAALLPALFPDAAIYFDSKSPGNWDSLTPTSYNQAVILVAKNFNADEAELNRLVYFAQQGNFVYIITHSISYNAIRVFNFSYRENLFDLNNSLQDSLWVKFEKSVYNTDEVFVYPGKRYETSFYTLDTARTIVLGRTGDGHPNFIEFKTGNGAIFVNSTPLAFSNYFLLHQNNSGYFQKAISVIPVTVNKIDWNEYYLRKPYDNGTREPDWLSVLFRYPSFRWGFITVLIMMVFFVLLGMRRSQRMIPLYEKPVNDSLAFVKTMGRLYYDRHDHHNLAKKMSAYFLDHVRTAYKLSVDNTDENFIRALHEKSAYPLEELTKIVSFINRLELTSEISDSELSGFYKELELFYQKT